MRIKLTMKNVRVAIGVIYSKSKWFKEELQSKGNLQNFKEHLVYMVKALCISFSD